MSSVMNHSFRRSYQSVAAMKRQNPAGLPRRQRLMLAAAMNCQLLT
jgi:hypothetical protein